jgi:hypothetical protein
MKSLFKLLFALPTPTELGMSDSDAIGSREMTPFQEGPMWEDWHAKVKELHPIKYFLSEKVGFWFSMRAKNVADAWYWLLCMTLYQHHKVDLRGVDPIDEYTHGYLEPCDEIRLACWKGLRRYVEKGEPQDPAKWDVTEEERASEWHTRQKAAYDEVMVLHHYWMEGRKQEWDEEQVTYREMRAAAEARDQEKYEAISATWLSKHKAMEDRAEEMLKRLISVRSSLWT